MNIKKEQTNSYNTIKQSSPSIYEFKNWQISLLLVIICILCLLYITIPLSNDLGTAIIVLLIFLIFILLPPILIMVIWNLIQKLIHHIVKPKYSHEEFPSTYELSSLLQQQKYNDVINICNKYIDIIKQEKDSWNKLSTFKNTSNNNEYTRDDKADLFLSFKIYAEYKLDDIANAKKDYLYLAEIEESECNTSLDSWLNDFIKNIEEEYINSIGEIR